MVVGDLLAEPGRVRERFVFGLEFDFSDDERCVGSVEFVDFPAMAFEVETVSGFVDVTSVAELIEDSLGVPHGDRVFEFGIGDGGVRLFEVEHGVCAHDADAYGHVRSREYVALRAADGRCGFAPAGAGDEEFSFDFDAHGGMIRGTSRGFQAVAHTLR